MLQKQELRKKLLRLRRDIDVKEKRDKDAAVFRKLIKLPEFERAEFILTYVSTESETDTRALIGYCLEKGAPLAIPGIVNGEMRFFRLKSMWDIDIHFNFNTPLYGNALAVVPGLAYNRDNNRLGYGGGYYDRFLRNFDGYKVGLCYREFILDVPVEEHDEKVDMVIVD